MANLDNVRNALLAKGHNKTEVAIFYDYVIKLSQDTKTNWINIVPDELVIVACERVHKTGFYIDGESITFSYYAKTQTIKISYDYHAYKNRVIKAYPETLFDLQLVHEGDNFIFEKDSGKVNYKHGINNPFDRNKIIVGCYCVTKNRRGEFIELINLDDINKFKASSLNKNVWEMWPGEMVKKSCSKRSNKTHFHDLVVDIEEIDNENYDPNIGGKTTNQLAADKTTQRKLNAILNSKSIQELNAIPDLNNEILQNAYKDKLNQLDYKIG